MASPLERYPEYFSLSSETEGFINTYFGGFYGMLSLILICIVILGFGLSLILIGLQVMYKLTSSKRYSAKKTQVAFAILIASAIIGGGQGFVIYRSFSQMLSVSEIMKASGNEVDDTSEYIPPTKKLLE